LGGALHHRPVSYTNAATGLAENDVPTPLTTYQVHVVGNKVAGVYLAGLVNISQDALTGAGYINYIDYAASEIFVGGNTADRTGARIALNDPSGRYGRVVSPIRGSRSIREPDGSQRLRLPDVSAALPERMPARPSADALSAEQPAVREQGVLRLLHHVRQLLPRQCHRPARSAGSGAVRDR
jgi:hypothetical protein